MQFVEISENGAIRAAGYAPYLDYEPLREEERRLAEPVLDAQWLRDGLEQQAIGYAVAALVPDHFDDVRKRKEDLIDKTKRAVHERLTKEITYWDHRATELKAQEEAGRTPRLNSARARQRVDDLEARLHKRMEDLEQEGRLSPLPPVAMGGAVIIPAGLLARLTGARTQPADATTHETARIERLAMDAVIAHERGLGFQPEDVGPKKCGYDVESLIPATGRLRFIEVKGRVADADTVTVSKNEILTALNKPEDFYLAIVKVDGDRVDEPAYLTRPFKHEPDFAVTSVTYNIKKLMAGEEANVALRQAAV